MNKLQKFITVSMMVLGMFVVSSTMLVGTSSAQITTGELLPTQVGTNLGANTQASLPETVANIIRVAMGLLGIVAVVIILIGGFTWMTAGGNDEKVGEAKKWIFSGVIGLAIILSAYAIASFVITNLVKVQNAGGGPINPVN